MRQKMNLAIILSMTLFALCLSGCASERSTNQTNTTQTTSITSVTVETESSTTTQNSSQDDEESSEEQGEESMNENSFYVAVNGETFTATFADNASAEALKEILKSKDITVDLRDYSGFEKVGALGEDIPRNDTNMTTNSGDILLYNGSQIVIFYGSNTWSYTKLGSIDNLTGWSEALGSGDVTVTLSKI